MLLSPLRMFISGREGSLDSEQAGILRLKVHLGSVLESDFSECMVHSRHAFAKVVSSEKFRL